jgi:hypothetical protein
MPCSRERAGAARALARPDSTPAHRRAGGHRRSGLLSCFSRIGLRYWNHHLRRRRSPHALAERAKTRLTMESAPITNNTDMHEICERYSGSFPPRGLKSLLDRSPLCWRQRRHAVLALGHSAVLACATATAATLPTSTRNRTGGRPRQRPQRFSGDLREKQKHRNSLRRPVAAVAALAPVCWLAPAPGASSPESALGVGPRLPRARRPGHPRFWRRKGTDLMGRANPGPFLDAVPDLSGIGTSRE